MQVHEPWMGRAEALRQGGHLIWNSGANRKPQNDREFAVLTRIVFKIDRERQ